MVNSRTRIMFLGGDLDHAIRYVPADGETPGKPASSSYRVADQTYHLTHFVSGGWEWWAYILEGHDPSRSHALDANPYPFVSSK